MWYHPRFSVGDRPTGDHVGSVVTCALGVWALLRALYIGWPLRVRHVVAQGSYTVTTHVGTRSSEFTDGMDINLLRFSVRRWPPASGAVVCYLGDIVLLPSVWPLLLHGFGDCMSRARALAYVGCVRHRSRFGPRLGNPTVVDLMVRSPPLTSIHTGTTTHPGRHLSVVLRHATSSWRATSLHIRSWLRLGHPTKALFLYRLGRS